jgi:DNA processing protein
MDELFIQRIALTMIDGVGDVLARQLVSYCGSVEAVFRERKRILQKIPDIGPKTATAITSFKGFDRAAREYDFVKRHNIEMFFYLDEDYPNRLRQCYDSPILLFYKGNAVLNTPRMIAIVGTRNATPYGKDFTFQLVQELSLMKVTVVSGLAYGIDISAHKACIQHGVETIGVVAHGLDRIYPSVHEAFARKMISNGGILTEHVSGTGPDKENFPRRNRIVAGLCDAVIVVEAAEKGGALITADIANSYNRDVFALPGRVSDTQSAGCNTLIQSNRAALIRSAQDLKFVMGWDDDDSTSSKSVQKKMFVELSGNQKLIFDFLVQNGKSTIDSIMINTGLQQSQIASALLGMEFDGLVRCLPGKLFETV